MNNPAKRPPDELYADEGDIVVKKLKSVHTSIEMPISDESNNTNESSPSGIPDSYKKHRLPNDADGANDNLLDRHFPCLSGWIFQGHRRDDVSVNLFQAGRKKNYGFMDNSFTMVYVPAKPDDLAGWLECLNRGAAMRPAGLLEEGYAHYTWQSVVALPRSKLTPALAGKYKCNEKPGFCDAPVVEDKSPGLSSLGLEGAFPKVAALAGLRKDRRVPKGWVSFRVRGDDGSQRLTVCRGNAKETSRSSRPKGLAFEGEGQHESVEEPLFRISGDIGIRGLHDLFCVVEGLLETL